MNKSSIFQFSPLRERGIAFELELPDKCKVAFFGCALGDDFESIAAIGNYSFESIGSLSVSRDFAKRKLLRETC